MTHICVTLSILRDPLEIVSLVSSGLAKAKQLEHGGATSFNAFSYLQSNCFLSKCNIITTQKNIKNIKTLLDIIRRNEFKLRRVPDFLDTFNTKCEQRMFDLCSPKIFLLQR